MGDIHLPVYLATSTLDLLNPADHSPDRLTLGVSVRDFILLKVKWLVNLVVHVVHKTVNSSILIHFLTLFTTHSDYRDGSLALL